MPKVATSDPYKTFNCLKSRVHDNNCSVFLVLIQFFDCIDSSWPVRHLLFHLFFVHSSQNWLSVLCKSPSEDPFMAEKTSLTLNNPFFSCFLVEKASEIVFCWNPWKGFREWKSLSNREQPRWSVESLNTNIIISESTVLSVQLSRLRTESVVLL